MRNMWASIGRAAMVVGIAGAIVALIGFGAVKTGLVHLGPQPVSESQGCVQTSSLVPSLVGDDTTTQIRISTPDLKNQRVLRTEPANRLPAMFENLLAVSPDSNRLAYVTADDEQMDNAHLTFVDFAHPDAPRVIATEASGLLPIRPVWSPAGDQVAFVVSRIEQGTLQYHVLAASTSGAPVLNIASLPANAFDQLERNFLCVTPTGAVSVLPPAPSANGAVAAAPSPIVVANPPTPSPAANGPVGGTRCSLPALSQNDPRWKDHKMEPTGESVGSVGCAVTSTAMVLDYFSANLTPDALSDCLGNAAVPIYWSLAVACTQGRVNDAIATDFDWAKLDAILAAGRPAIVGMLGGPVGMHFVVVTSGGGDIGDEYRIVDPWDGRSDGTLGGYTRRNWTLFQLVDFRSQGPGCGKLLVGGVNDALKVISGISDGARYSTPVTIKRLIAGVPVTVKRIAVSGDQQWNLGSSLTLSDNGIYRVFVYNNPSGLPTVLSFAIDRTPPSVTVQFLNQVTPLRQGLAIAQVPPALPTVGFPGRFAVVASDPYTGVTEIQAQLDNEKLIERDSPAGIANRALIGVVAAPGKHHLAYSATNAVGLKAGGAVDFYVQTTAVVGPPIVIPNGVTAVPATLPPPVIHITPPTGLFGPPTGIFSPKPILASPPSGLLPPPTVVHPILLCTTLTTVTLADSVSGATHTLHWQGNGTCGPISGNLTVTYSTWVTNCLLFGACTRYLNIATHSYSVTAASGSQADIPPAGIASVAYSITLTDSGGHSATASTN